MFISPLQNPFTDNSELQQRTARMLSLNTWDVAVALTNFDWTIFDSVHEVCPTIWMLVLSCCLNEDESLNEMTALEDITLGLSQYQTIKQV